MSTRLACHGRNRRNDGQTDTLNQNVAVRSFTPEFGKMYDSGRMYQTRPVDAVVRQCRVHYIICLLHVFVIDPLSCFD
jgi:hypothetical protein